jgi:hypothetical protein
VLSFRARKIDNGSAPMPARRKALALTLLGFGLAGRSFAAPDDRTNSRPYSRPYSEVEAALLQRLELEAPAPGAKPTRAWVADRLLKECLGGSGYVTVQHYEPGQRLQLARGMRYKIGVGHWSLEIEVSRTSTGLAKIRVDYVDKAAGFLVIPFAYVNPGWIRQARIRNCLARIDGPPKQADRIPQPPPRLDELVCERLQGRACGPPEALLTCQTASGQPLLCTCRGSWSCG